MRLSRRFLERLRLLPKVHAKVGHCRWSVSTADNPTTDTAGTAALLRSENPSLKMGRRLAAQALIGSPFLAASSTPARLARAEGARIPDAHQPIGESPPGSGRLLDRSRLRLTFAEEFDRLVASPEGIRCWRTTFANGERTLPTNREAQHYVDPSSDAASLAVEDGVLSIRATPRAAPGGLTYTSGLLTTQRLFWQRYGHFEMRARMPAGHGFWPAFWLLPVDQTWPPELDVVEVLGHAPSTLWVSVHTRGNGERRATTFPVPVIDLSADFHLYGASWNPEVVRWYLDDLEVASAPTPSDMHKPMYMLVNLAVGGPGSWPGPADGVSSAELRVDYVRAYHVEPGTP